MIEALGKKRLIILAVLALLNASLGAGAYLYGLPKSEELVRKERQSVSQLSTKRSEVQRLKEDFVFVQEKVEDFEVLKSIGFLNDQDRNVAQAHLLDIKEFTGVLDASSYEIGSIDVSTNSIVSPAGYVVKSSSIDISLEAMDDMDVYHFIYWIENAFPGHVSLMSLKVDKNDSISAETLKSIGRGQAPSLVSAKLRFNWRTLQPENDGNSDTGGSF